MVIVKIKKVRPQMNNTIKNMDYTWSPGPEPPNNQEAGVPRAIFIPHANSLPFEERRVTLEQPVKIGRNVYRATPTPTNTIFECRVLSRHHATLYYDKGHFYLLDNQSSNGTFVNNNRCSISKDQEPHEVFSGDVVQFGISVVENAGNAEKNTFPPVVALLKLFHPDGKEAKLSFNPTMTTPLHLKELYQLNNFVQEAIGREASLESRLRTLRECVERTRAEAQSSWELFVGEQRLLMRVHTLESMLAVGKQPDLHHVHQLLDDKRNYQEVAQESLRAAHEQRLALEETLERRGREAAALHQHNCALRLAANNALQELQKLAARCERRMYAARVAIAAAEEREANVRSHLPITYSVQNGEAKMLVLSSDSNRVTEARRGALEDAVRALPDYVKLLLPPQLLGKVGIKAVSAEGNSAKEFELILKTNNIYDAESREKQQEEQSESGVGVSGEKGESDTIVDDLCTDDEKQSRLNHDTDIDSSSPLDGELVADNNANSTYTEQPTREDEPSKGGVEYANVLRVMAGLNDEIKALRERLAAANGENEQLRGIRDELLAAHCEPRDEPPQPQPEDAAAFRARIDELQGNRHSTNKDEQLRGIRDELLAAHCEPRDEPPQPQPEDAAAFRARIDELQDQLTRSTEAEEAKQAEIQRLSSSAAELQAKLAFRPTRAELDDLTACLAQLHADLAARDETIARLQSELAKDKAYLDAQTSTSLEEPTTPEADPGKEELDTGKISAEIDEMFRLDYEDEDEETDSLDTEVLAPPAAKDDSLEEIASQHEDAPANLSSSSEYIKLPDEDRLQETLANGSLHALEEELVRAKEKWAEATAEKAKLAAQLATLQTKPAVSPQRILTFVVPVVAVAIFWLLLPYIS